MNDKHELSRILPLLANPVGNVLGGIFFVLGLIMFGVTAGLYLHFDNDPALVFKTDPPEAVLHWLPYLIPGLGGLIFLLVGSLMLALHARKQRKLLRLLRSGKQASATVVSNHQNFHHRVNDIPQRVVVFQTSSGTKYEYRFFGEEFAQHLPMGTTIEIRHDNDGNALPDATFFQSLTGD